MRMPAHRLLCPAVALLAGVAAACGGGKAPIATATPSASPTAAATIALPAATTVRALDVAAPAVMAEMRRHFGDGSIEPRRVAYADLDGDGVEDALAVVESGGTAGDLGAIVFTIRDGRLAVLAFIDRAGHLELQPPSGATPARVVVTQGVGEPGDPLSSPSRLREIVLGWDGTGLAVVSERVIPNPRR